MNVRILVHTVLLVRELPVQSLLGLLRRLLSLITVRWNYYLLLVCVDYSDYVQWRVVPLFISWRVLQVVLIKERPLRRLCDVSQICAHVTLLIDLALLLLL